jgi:5-methylcytosine-specific restriction endonuclease McrA
MWKLTKPVEAAKEAFELSKSNARGLRRTRLDGYTKAVIARSRAFESAARDKRVHTILRATESETQFVDDMAWLYENKFRGGLGRPLYDKIKLSTEVCPLCVRSFVGTLDHYLPKGYYPALAVTPANLVPACGDCNDFKLSQYPTAAKDATMNPYFDDIASERWLFARIVECKPAALLFFIAPPSGWKNLKKKRLASHFRTFHLLDSYKQEGARQISSNQLKLARLFARGGKEEVKRDLQDSADTWKEYSLNCWQAAAFEAMAESEWYCDEGFRI